ncbi:MAG: hypothetical protein HOM48_05720 [Rhodobiaceae bacterium]|nr:hypothetical protein [Rhodobiaceae bacterium]MDG2495435.1 hypothetical protein [Alphaproteobacteria bacterium]
MKLETQKKPPMKIVRSRQRPRCAVCASSSIALNGVCVWHGLSQTWRVTQPQLKQTPNGALRPSPKGQSFYCQDCEAEVGVNFGKL